MQTLFVCWTLFVALVFLSVVVWALGGGRHKEFEEAARIPLNDEIDAGEERH